MSVTNKRLGAKMKPSPAASRRRAILLLATLVLLLAGSAIWGLIAGLEALFRTFDDQYRVTDSDLDVVISTGRMVHPDLITGFFGLTNGANLAQIDFAALRARLLAKVPNIRDIRIERRLPNRVTVDVTERVPAVRVLGPSRHDPAGRVADAEGVIFRFSRDVADLPIVRDGTQPALQPGQRLSGNAAAALRLALVLRDANDLGDLRVLDIDTSRKEYLFLTLGNYSRAKIAWEHMDCDDARARTSLHRQLWRLGRAVESNLTPGTTLWNALDYEDKGRVYANDPTLSARQKGS